MRSVVLGVGVTVLIAGACAVTPDYVLVNRSDVAVAIAPNVQIAPCSAANFTESELKAAGEAFLERAMQGDFSWVPADAVALTGGIPGPRIGAPRPMVFVISGSNLPQVFYGPGGGEPQM